MANVTLVYSQSCGACPAAKELWKGLRVKHSFSYREVDILSPDGQEDRKSTRLNSSHIQKSRMPSSA